MKAAIIGLVAVAIIGGGGYVLLHESSRSSNNSKTVANNQTQSSNSTSQNSSDTITYDGNQFSPASITVKSGTTVTIKNSSTEDMQLDSNPHPVHTDDTDLNVGLVLPGQSKTFTVTKTGTFGYHNHLSPSIEGKITIE